MENQGRKKGFDYKWVIVALSFLMVLTCLGFCSSPKSLFIGPVTKALGIQRSAFSLNDSCRFVTTAIINLFFGALINKFGPKKLIGAGFLCLIASSLIYSFATNVFVFYIGGCLLGLGLSWTTTTMVGCIINQWCKENKGTIMGLVLAANGIGGAIAIQIVSPIIEQGVYGYRAAYRVIALILLAVAVLIMIFFKDRPKNAEEGEIVVSKKKARGQSWPGIEYSEAVKTPYFYAAIVCIFLTGLVLQGINGVAAAHMKDVGLDPTYVASVLSVHSLALAGFKFLTGFIYDRCGLRTTITICSVMAVVVMIALAMITNTAFGMVLAMVYGIFSSLALPLETIVLPLYASDLFGEKSFNKILGLFVSFNTAGYALGAPLINACYDLFNSYTVGFYACSVVMVINIVALQLVISAAHRKRKEVLNAQETVSC
ncbi:MAG: MFS transporter [Clostridia bacterium]|nr:MFS transporter [Clostridia bacterium]